MLDGSEQLSVHKESHSQQTLTGWNLTTGSQNSGGNYMEGAAWWNFTGALVHHTSTGTNGNVATVEVSSLIVGVELLRPPGGWGFMESFKDDVNQGAPLQGPISVLPAMEEVQSCPSQSEGPCPGFWPMLRYSPGQHLASLALFPVHCMWGHTAMRPAVA